MCTMNKRQLNLLDVFCISTGAMISSGIFVLPGLAYAKSGPAMILAYMLAAILIIPSMFAKAELATAMPKAGGIYFYIDRSLGPWLGIFGGFANWFSLSFKSAFALIGMGAFAVLIYPDIDIVQVKIIAVIICLIFALTNILSVKVTGRIQVILVFLLLAILTLYIGRGFISTHPENYHPFMPMGFSSIVATAGLVFVSFGGLTKIASIAEEIENPGRNIPLGMLLSFTVVTLIYLLAIGVTIGIVPAEELQNSAIPLSLGAGRIMGKPGVIALSIAAMTAFITTANSGILAASRTPMAMSRDQLLPKIFARINPKSKTPVVSIIFTTAFMIIVIVFLNIENLVKTASTLKILLFMMNNISVIIMRESKIQNYRPKFKVPLYPFLPVLAIISYLILLVNMGWIPLLISLLFFILGLIIYFAYARKKIDRTSALMHIIERISAKELKSTSLEDELRQIVITRDEIIEDRFDKLIKNCDILDIEGSPKIDTLIMSISRLFEKRCKVSKNDLIHEFNEREAQSSTIIKPGLAIPHIIIPGEKCFEIIPVRCKEGIRYPETEELVHTMFVLIGTLDERSYHLRALMAIANLVQESGFNKRWMSARNTDELRDVILLSNRKRES
ncbi:MAG: amino acid permease [Candidatus Marinimicrobia bacterium]|nr:amino acid permease [Candidatus Neomarinimicrobiota bacterium]